MKGHPVEQVRVSKLKPHPKNYRKHPPEQLRHIMASLKQHGFYRNVVVAKDWTILAGHGVVLAAKKLKLDTVPVVRLDVSSRSAKALKLLAGDNEMWRGAEDDEQALARLLKQVMASDEGLLGTGFDDGQLEALLAVLDSGLPGGSDGDEGGSSAVEYTRKIESPVYRPTQETPPPVAELYDATKLQTLQEDIDKAQGLPDDVQAFLKLAAHRHVVFDYQSIAEFYAHAPKKTQALMERSALVIIDFKKAIEQGFVQMTTGIAEGFPDAEA